MDKEKMIRDIMDLVVKVNGGAAHRNCIGHPTAFIYFSGHVANLEVQIYENGWTGDGASQYKKFYFYFGSSFMTDDDLERKFNELRAYAFYLKFKRRKKDDLHN